MTDFNFDFNKAVVETFESKYLTPGNHSVKVSEVKSGVSSLKQSPYIEITVQDQKGLTCSQQFYLTTTAGPSGKSAMDITSANLVILVAAAIVADVTTEDGKNAAKAKIGNVTSIDALVKQITTLTVGKNIAIHLNGKIINPTDTTKKDWIKAEFATGVFAVPVASIGKLKADVKIKGEYSTPNTNGASAVSAPTSTTTW